MSRVRIVFFFSCFFFTESVSLRRKIPKNLKEGEPNLLLVPKGAQNTMLQLKDWHSERLLIIFCIASFSFLFFL